MYEENENNDNEEKDNGIKIILIGDSGTGKTNLITVTAGFEFNTNTLTTTTCSYIQKIIKKENKEYKVNLWDTIGQEKYRSLTKIFVKDSNIVIFIYDITKRETFESLKYWKSQIDQILGNNITLGVVGNKIDLYLEEKVQESEGKEFAASIGAKFTVASAKDNPKEFATYIEEIFEEYLKKNNNNDRNRKNTITIKKESEKKGRCC